MRRMAFYKPHLVAALIMAVGIAGCGGSSSPSKRVKIDRAAVNGGTLLIGVSYACPAGTPGTISLEAAVGFSGGFGAPQSAVCDGTEHQADIPATGGGQRGDKIDVVVNLNSTTVLTSGYAPTDPGVPAVPGLDRVEHLASDGETVTLS
ncbi:hypothetical protein [Pseudofrankia inefficax]|uniref:Lipoprotein n=1 Tax=Pseudofrankia inefficax (strain DSM 45817 / CECT 9037 / DDB 130130 / EuI1c) TaxID=298654 RepID=E3J2G9_PSEI1|nr:hypothetical protein [Pseudofrankia inefficax]ADP79341.1 hypothetical protein FraEuI1c_1269 [Pseudofrankia inefficax]